METTPTFAISREAARLAFLCSSGMTGREDFAPAGVIDYDSSFEQEKAELLAGIRKEVESSTHHSDLCIVVCGEILDHLAGAIRAPYAWLRDALEKDCYTIQ